MLLGMGHFRVAPRFCFKLRLSAKPWIWRYNNYWMRLSKILWFVSWRLRQIIDLWDTDKSRYFAITKLNNNFFIVLSFNHRVCFLMDIFRKPSDFCHFHARVIARRRKAWLPLRMSRKLFATKQSWTTLRMSRPLLSRQFSAAMWWALGQWKERNICNEWHFLFSCK